MEDLNVDLNTLYYDAHLIIRSNVGVAIKIRKSLSAYPNRLQMFQRSCFGSWLDLECDNRDPSLVHLILQTQYMPDHDVDHLLFFVGGQELKFSRREFCLITGLRFGPQNFLESRFSNPFRDRVFGHKAGKPIKGSDIKYVFENEVDKLGDVDHVRVCLLLLLHFGFLGCEAKISIDDRVLVFVEDLAAWNQFPWASYSWDATIRTLRNAVGKRQALHFTNLTEGLPTYSLSGFVWAFKIWIYEVFPYGRLTGYCLKREGVIPRGVAWRRTHIGCPWEITRRFVTSALKPRFLPIRELIPTPEEEATYWWIESQPSLEGVDTQTRVKRPRGAPEHAEIPDPTREFFQSNDYIPRNEESYSPKGAFQQSQTLFPGFRQPYTPTGGFQQSQPDIGQSYHGMPCPAFGILDPRVSTLESQYTDFRRSFDEFYQNTDTRGATYESQYTNLCTRFDEYHQTNQEYHHNNDLRVSSLEKQLMDIRLELNQGQGGTHFHQASTNMPENEVKTDFASPSMLVNDVNLQDYQNQQTPPLALRRSPRNMNKGPTLCTPYTGFQSSIFESTDPRAREGLDTEVVEEEDDLPKEFWASTPEHFYLVEKTQHCYLALEPAGLAYNKEFWGLLLGLTSNGWLDNFHIDAWIQHLILTSTSRDPRCAVMPTFFMSIFKDGPRVVKFGNGTLSMYPHWSEVDRVLIPLNDQDSKHWMLGELDLNKKQMVFYDSMSGGHWSFFEGVKGKIEKYLMTYLDRIDYWKRAHKKKPKKKITLDLGQACGVPRQRNGWDCGVLVSHFIELRMENLDLIIEGDINGGYNIGIKWHIVCISTDVKWVNSRVILEFEL